jgi:hypothetical protein
MTDDGRYANEAERHLAIFMEKQRQERITSDILEAAFAQNEISSADDGGPAQDYAEARAAATAYAKGRNANTRIRSYPQENASQREGVQAAISWLDRKRKSAIRK